MSNSIFDGIVKFETFYEAEGIHPDLGVSWHVIGAAHIIIDGDYEAEIAEVDVYLCADTNHKTTPHDFTKVDYYVSCRNALPKDLVREIEIKLTENAGKEDDAMVSEFADQVLAYWSAPAAAVKVTLIDIVHVQTEAA